MILKMEIFIIYLLCYDHFLYISRELFSMHFSNADFDLQVNAAFEKPHGRLHA